jgi:DNA repair exonuclease SbcCD ATPase subunit
MSFVSSLFVRKKTGDSKDSHKRRSIMIASQESAKIKEIQDQLNNERHKNIKLEDGISKAEESYKHKIEDYERQIKELREQIAYYRLHPTPTTDTIDKHITEAENMHQKVVFAINDFKKQIDQQLRDQERDTIKRFDLKLAKVCNEIEERKKKRVMELSSMANTEKKIAKDLENLRESAILVERKNEFLEQENCRIESKIKEKDSEFQDLMQEYYYARRRVPDTSDSVISEKADLMYTPKLSISGSELTEDKTDRYESVIAKLRRQLESERKALRSVRISYAQELEQRTEMENIVRRFVEEIRDNQASRGRLQSAYEERAILIDRLLNSVEVAAVMSRGPYQQENEEELE